MPSPKWLFLIPVFMVLLWAGSGLYVVQAQAHYLMMVLLLIALVTSALSNASYLRVHDVELTKDTIMIIDKAKSLM